MMHLAQAVEPNPKLFKKDTFFLNNYLIKIKYRGPV